MLRGVEMMRAVCGSREAWAGMCAGDLLRVADEIEDEVAERYMELPLDADGEYIHVGDVVRFDDEDTPFEVRAITYLAGYETEVGDGERWGDVIVHLFHHHHEPTVEDVLREFTDAVLEWSRNVGESGTWGDVAAEYAAKLRLAGEATSA